MKKLLMISIVAFTIIQCKNKEQDRENTTTEISVATKTTTATLSLGCYKYDDGKNKITFEVLENEKEIRGNLDYALAEKDRNTGQFIGTQEEDVIIGIYAYQSEGLESTREIAFKIEGDKLIEGYGELSDDGTSFQDISSIEYTSSMPLEKTNCE